MEKSEAYISLLWDLVPLFSLAFSIFFLKGLKGLRAGLMGATFFTRFVGIVVSSALGGAFAVGCALLLPLFDRGDNPATMLGVVVFVSIAGVKIVDAALYKKLGVHFIDASEAGSADATWASMNREEREECMRDWKKDHCHKDRHGEEE